MKDPAIDLLLGGFPIVWGTAMILYTRRHPERLRSMSYSQFRVFCLVAIGVGIALVVFILFHLK
jgi:hypothetical protein